MKNKRRFGKTQVLFFLKLTVFNVWGMPNGFMTNYIPAWRLWPSKNWSVKINERYNKFCLLNENILSVQLFFFFFTCYTAQTQINFSTCLLNTLLKLSEKRMAQISLFSIPLAVSKRILNIYEIPYIYDRFSTFLSVHQDL